MDVGVLEKELLLTLPYLGGHLTVKYIEWEVLMNYPTKQHTILKDLNLYLNDRIVSLPA
jgi:hypothetical protein